ncbi:DUF2384 domain-containing protein [Halomonas sp. QX-2]|uniref:DUF2384 domain-containing protein n=1 Tax=Vreelandella sedimenti TaxID=2729618 RepID=A0A7Z0N7B2_9GAMM|nr:DUF2384 domain-containing protein [Halomonas sedimenti]
MSRSNKTLAGRAPILLCVTEFGTKQIRRVLHAMMSGVKAAFY